MSQTDPSFSPRLVLYTAHYGGSEPLNTDVFGGFDSCDRVLFTDNPKLEFPGARIVVDPLDGLDPARASRRSKLMPHRYLPEYDWSLYIDNNAILKVDPVEVFARLRALGPASFYAFPHPLRDCVYQEAHEISRRGKEDHKVIADVVRRYRDRGVPEHVGLIEGCFLLRNHHDPVLARFGDRWFEQVLSLTRRDQMSFPVLRDAIQPDLRIVVEIDRLDLMNKGVFFGRKDVKVAFAPPIWALLANFAERARKAVARRIAKLRS